jgi:hypothetical protein
MDLTHAGQNIVAITLGNGCFKIDYKYNKITERLVSNINLDIICLNQSPLHIIPLLI